MIIIPAIDLQNGRCVRLKQGQFDQVSLYDTPPAVLVDRYLTQGASRLHVVDLDGAKSGSMQQLSLIQTLIRPNLDLQAGGGIRSISEARACLEKQINRVVIGSIAISAPNRFLEIVQEVGADKIVLAIDIRIDNKVPKAAIHGWQTAADTSLWDIAAIYQQSGITQILCTDIACDGMMQGPNFRLYEEAAERFPNIHWQASGGIRDKKDIDQLAGLGASAVILGKTLYENPSELAACLKEYALC